MEGFVSAGLGVAIVPEPRPGEMSQGPVAILAALCCLVSSAAVFSARETRGVSLERLDAAVPAGKTAP
jgi:hypothetical protein